MLGQFQNGSLTASPPPPESLHLHNSEQNLPLHPLSHPRHSSSVQSIQRAPTPGFDSSPLGSSWSGNRSRPSFRGGLLSCTARKYSAQSPESFSAENCASRYPAHLLVRRGRVAFAIRAPSERARAPMMHKKVAVGIRRTRPRGDGGGGRLRCLGGGVRQESMKFFRELIFEDFFEK